MQETNCNRVATQTCLNPTHDSTLVVNNSNLQLAHVPLTQPSQAVVGGTASSGMIICLLRVLTKAAFTSSTNGLFISSALYFGFSVLLSVACFVAYVWVLPSLAVVQHWRKKSAEGGWEVCGVSQRGLSIQRLRWLTSRAQQVCERQQTRNKRPVAAVAFDAC